MDFEKNVPDWSATGTEPPESLKQSGFEAGYKPPAAYFNWFWNRVSACLAEIREKLKDHAEDKENPHGVTAAQVGLGNADNTADSEKHVAYAGTAGSANKVENQLTIRFNGGGTESTDKWTFDGSTSRSVNITPEKIGAAKDDLSNVENADLQSKVASAAVGVPIANAESSDGIAYTATVPGVTELINGMLLTIIPSMTSTSTSITLDVNGLGATSVRLPLSFNTAAMDRPRLDTFYVAERPITLQYDANYAAGGIWKVFEKNKTSAQDLYGVVPIESGGTNAKTAEEALENLGAAPKVHTHTVGDVDGAFAAADYDGLVTKTGNPVVHTLKAGRGISAVTTLLPIQSGSGEPYPAGGGKNLLPYFSAETKNGITLSVANDGTITLNGTPSADTAFVVSLASALPTGTYTMSLSSNAVNGYVAVWLENTDDWSTIGSVANGALNNSQSFETTKAYQRAKLTIYTSAGTLSNLQLKIQLERDSTATEYAPYANIRPISGRTGVELTRCGKNLMGNEADDLLVGADGVLQYFNPALALVLPVCGIDSICVSGDIALLSEKVVRVGLYNQYPTIGTKGVRKTYGHMPFVLDVSGVEYVALSFLPDKNTNITKEQVHAGICVNIGTEPISEPYNGDTYAASFGQTVYGGTLDWLTGALTVDRGILTMDGTEDIAVSNDSPNKMFVCRTLRNGNITDWTDTGSTAPIVCSHFTNSTADIVYGVNNVNMPGLIAQKNCDFWFTRSNYASLDEFKAYLAAQYTAGTPVQVCYKLATPTTIQLTPQMVAALNGTNTVYTDGDGNVVTLNHDRALVYIMDRIAALETASVNA